METWEIESIEELSEEEKQTHYDKLITLLETELEKAQKEKDSLDKDLCRYNSWNFIFLSSTVVLLGGSSLMTSSIDTAQVIGLIANTIGTTGILTVSVASAFTPKSKKLELYHKRVRAKRTKRQINELEKNIKKIEKESNKTKRR